VTDLYDQSERLAAIKRDNKKYGTGERNTPVKMESVDEPLGKWNDGICKKKRKKQDGENVGDHAKTIGHDHDAGRDLQGLNPRVIIVFH